MPKNTVGLPRRQYFLPTTLLAFVAVAGWFAAGASAAGPGTSALPAQQVPEIREQPMAQLLAWLIHPDSKLRNAVYKELKRRQDLSAVPGLIELLRVPAFARDADPRKLARALKDLTGQSFGQDSVAWSEWQSGQQSIPLPDEFLLWKATLFGLIDPGLQGFLETPYPPKIRPDEILWGGVRKDDIPALDDPKMISADEATYLRRVDLVFGVEINGDARAYPLRVLAWHEMLNAVVGGEPVSLAFCTLCRSGILFDTTVGGTTYTFGSSGFLYQSNKLMYDRQTESLWTTIPGKPVVGPLSTSDLELEKLPLVVTSWKEWAQKHPGTLVLSLETGYDRDYSPGAAYGDYFNSEEIWFPISSRDWRVEPKEEVFAITLGGIPKAYVVNALRRRPVLNDSIGERSIVVLTSRDGAVRAYERGRRTFSQARGDDVLKDGEGQTWQVKEAHLFNESSQETLARLPGHLAYWFGWFAFYPGTLLFDGSK